MLPRLLHIPETPDSNFSSEAEHPDKMFRDFHQCLQEHTRNVPEIRPVTISSTICQIHYPLIVYNLGLRNMDSLRIFKYTLNIINK
jgi:hypothetical protein